MKKIKWNGMIVPAILLIFLIAACGGSGNISSSTDGSGSESAANDDSGTSGDEESGDSTSGDEEAPATDAAPEIVDKYVESFVKYKDVSLYNGEYSIMSDPVDTCSGMFGKDMQDGMDIYNITEIEVSVLVDSAYMERFGSLSTVCHLYDVWAYTGQFRSHDCAVLFGTHLSDFDTLDLMGIACQGDSYGEFCITGYSKKADYNFHDKGIIKNPGYGEMPEDLQKTLEECVRAVP